MITTIIFDAEGVVLDTEAVWDQAQVEFLRRRGIRYQREQLKPLLTGQSLVEGVRVMQALYGFPGDPEKLAQERLAIVKAALATGVNFIAGFTDFFALVTKNYKVCIATAMDRSLFQTVENALDLRAFFAEKMFFIDEVRGKGKPQPDIFLHAARQLHSAVEECVVIEDSPLGVEAAKRAGMLCVALTTTYERKHLCSADCVVDSFVQCWKSIFCRRCFAINS
ncbi:MAG: HAD family phosphatase [Deltaproteobacteria bacterium]|nr:HAD family phosphatase [Deltaproteobacteria bacterium]